jgi:prepilin-type N-terminal cleavage/methylation domain-containing protein
MTIRKLQALKAKKGFTLIELIVVIAIIAVLAAILIPILMNYVTSSRIASADSEAKNIHTTTAAAIGVIESRNDTLPQGSFRISIPTTGGWVVTAGLASENTGWITPIKERLDADLPTLVGSGFVTIHEGAAVAVIWDRGATGATLPAGNDYKVPGGWEKARQGDRTRTNVFGTYPDLPSGTSGT